jgi:hypothetical protein
LRERRPWIALHLLGRRAPRQGWFWLWHWGGVRVKELLEPLLKSAFGRGFLCFSLLSVLGDWHDD